MDDKSFLHAWEFIKTGLSKLEMNRAFNSIGSNVFFEFGQGREVNFENGKKATEREWSIWISEASWRISKKGEYIVGSNDSSEVIQSNIQKLLGKRLQFFQFTSQFLDVDFHFEDEYQLTTFFNLSEENGCVAQVSRSSSLKKSLDERKCTGLRYLASKLWSGLCIFKSVIGRSITNSW